MQSDTRTWAHSSQAMGCFHRKGIEKGRNALIHILPINCLLAGSLIQFLNTITCRFYYLLTCNCLSQQPEYSLVYNSLKKPKTTYTRQKAMEQAWQMHIHFVSPSMISDSSGLWKTFGRNSWVLGKKFWLFVKRKLSYRTESLFGFTF